MRSICWGEACEDGRRVSKGRRKRERNLAMFRGLWLLRHGMLPPFMMDREFILSCFSTHFLPCRLQEVKTLTDAATCTPEPGTVGVSSHWLSHVSFMAAWRKQKGMNVIGLCKFFKPLFFYGWRAGLTEVWMKIYPFTFYPFQVFRFNEISWPFNCSYIIL